jgi:hypothetical protein
MDRIMRQGILQGFDHSRNNVQIKVLLLKELDTLILRMRIFGVKHLKDIIPIISNILTDPFSSAQPDLLVSAAKVSL